MNRRIGTQIKYTSLRCAWIGATIAAAGNARTNEAALRTRTPRGHRPSSKAQDPLSPGILCAPDGMAAAAGDRQDRRRQQQGQRPHTVADVASVGGQSAHGTFLAFGPDRNLPVLLGWLHTFHAPTAASTPWETTS